MGFRMVSDVDAKNENDARAFVVSDTGGQVVPSGRVDRVANGYRVECFSADGRAHMPLAAGRELFAVDAISECGKAARIKDSYGIVSVVPRKLPAFGADLLGMETQVTLEKGNLFSAVRVGNDLTQAMLEEGEGAAIERPTVESVGPNPVAHKIEEAKQNYEHFMKQFKDGVSEELPTEVVPEPRVETEKDRNDFMKRLLDDLRLRE